MVHTLFVPKEKKILLCTLGLFILKVLSRIYSPGLCHGRDRETQ